jgi:hypothetical protein
MTASRLAAAFASFMFEGRGYSTQAVARMIEIAWPPAT